MKERENGDLFSIIRSVVATKKCTTILELSKEFPHISPAELQGMYTNHYNDTSSNYPLVHFKKLKTMGVLPNNPSKLKNYSKEKEPDESEKLFEQLIELLADEYTVSLTSIMKLLGIRKPMAVTLMKRLETEGIIAKGRGKGMQSL